MMKPTDDTNPSVSLNFDAQALHNQEEAEYEREEQQRQQELRDLLTTAFDCDFTDEDEDVSADSTGATSNEEADISHQEAQQNQIGWGTPGSNIPNLVYGVPLQQTSTPMAGVQPAPPLSTPAPTPYLPQHLHHGPGPPAMPYPMMEPQYNYPTHGIGPNHHQTLNQNDWPVQHTADQGFAQQPAFHQLAFGPREEAEGGNEHPALNYFDSNPQLHPQMHGHYYGNQEFSRNPPGAPPPQNAGLYGQILQQEGDSAFKQPTPQQPHPHLGNDNAASANVMGSRGGADHPTDDLEGYRVTYMGNTAGHQEQPEHDHQPTKPSENIPISSSGQERRAELDAMQIDFLSQGGASDDRQLSQLQILYDARGRKIEELTQEMNTLRDDSDREIRILKHKLALTQDERDGMDGSLKQSQALLGDAHRREADVKGKAQALESQVGALQQNKEELVKKLQTAESTIESLNAQLCELEKSESLSRARDHHNNIVTSIQHKYEAEILDLKEKLDKTNRNNQEKNDEIEDLKKKLKHLQKEMEEKQIERADTINRLSKSLENSQKQCEQMLEAGTGQELSKLKVQIQEVIAGKAIAEDMNSALSGELQELKEQVMMYESASQFGILPSGNSTGSTQLGGVTYTTGADDSYSQLGIKSNKGATEEEPGSNSSTPRSNVGDGSLSSEQTLQGLKKELERCLAMYRTKRQQVTNLQEELRKTRFSLEEMTIKLDDCQKQAEDSVRKLSEYESEVGPLGGKQGQETVQERRLQRQIDALSKDKKLLEEEVNELMGRIEEIAESEERLKEANLELGHQMAEMVKEYDEDKRQALEQCESTVLQHHERVKAQLEADLRDAFSQEKEEVIKEYERNIAELKSDLDSANAELDEVKDLYIAVCQSKEHLVESNEQLLHEKVEEKMKELMDVLQTEKEEEIKKLKETWSANNDTAIAAAKETWIKEQEQELQKEIDIKVELSKTTWLREHAGAKETAVTVALMEAEEKWKKQGELKMEEKISKALLEAKEAWEKDKETEIKEEVTRLHASAQEGQIEIESRIAEKIEEAHELWCASELAAALAEEKAKFDEQLASCLEEAKQDWREAELLPALKEAKELANKALSAQDPDDLKIEVASMLSEAKEFWLEEQRQAVEAEVMEVERAAAEEAQRQIEEASLQMEQELSDIQNVKLQLEEELAAMQAKMVEEKATVITSKDAERRQAVLTAQDQCERDYRVFLDEHQDTLNKALKTAREEYAREKAELEREHAEEIKGYKEREIKMSQAEMNFNKERADLEQEWHQKIEAMAAKHAEEKDFLIRSHRENLLKALEEARLRWQQKYEEALEESSSLVNEKETDWEEERNALQKEIDALKFDSAALHQQDILRLKAEMEKATEIKISQLKSAHQMEVQTVNADLRKQLDMRSAEMERLSEEVRACVAGLEEAQRVAAEEAQELKSAISQRDSEIARLKAELTASGQRVEQCESINTDVIQKLEDMQKQTDRIERDKKETEKDLTHMNDSYQDLVEKLQKAERKLKAAELNTQKHIAMVQESMEREHSVAMEKMKAKMVELRSNHVIAVDNLRKQHVSEKQEWKKTMEQLRQELSSEKSEDSMNKHYMKTVTKMRAEVLRHVKESNARAAETVREQIVKERQSTARRLRRYYMKCLNHLLDAENQNMTRAEKLAYMEQALEYVPSRDTSQLTSRSSGRSNCSTPDDLTPRNTAMNSTSATSSTNITQRNSQVRPRAEYQSPGQAKHSASDSRIRDYVENMQTRVKTATDDLVTKDDQYVSTHSSESQRSKSRNKTATGHKSLDSYESRGGHSQHSVPRLDLSNIDQSQMSTPYNQVSKSSLKNSSTRRQRSSQLVSWDSENSSGDNTHSNSHYFKTPKSNKKEKHVVLDDSAVKAQNSSNFTPNRSKYNLSSKSAEHFSIEKPRSSKSRTRVSDEHYQLDFEMPSMHKSQSATSLEHSTPRGQYSSDTEPRQYYDVDFGTFSSSRQRPARERGSGPDMPLTKVSSETYLLTPVGLQSGLHGSMSMGDVRDLDESNQSLTDTKQMCRSDEGLLNCDTDSIHSANRRVNMVSQGSGPLKCMSMPDVANPDDLGWMVNSKAHTGASYQHYENHDSGDTTMSESTEASPHVPVRSKPRTINPSHLHSHKSLRSTYGNLASGKREQHHVAFKNVDTNCEDDGSDESVKSFLSTSSVSSFRHKLKTKQVHQSASASTSSYSNPNSVVKNSGANKPLKAPPPSEELQHMLAQVPDNVHRPVAMVTRHTQMPSPRTVYRLTQQFETRD